MACPAPGENLKYQIPKSKSGDFKTLTEPGQEIQIGFPGKLHLNELNGEIQKLVAIDRFSNWPTVKSCKTSETIKSLTF